MRSGLFKSWAGTMHRRVTIGQHMYCIAIVNSLTDLDVNSCISKRVNSTCLSKNPRNHNPDGSNPLLREISQPETYTRRAVHSMRACIGTSKHPLCNPILHPARHSFHQRLIVLIQLPDKQTAMRLHFILRTGNTHEFPV